jgi:hypothetical protein
MSDEIRFQRFCFPEPMSGCWLWDGAVSNSYSRKKKEGCRSSWRSIFRFNGKAQSGSRVSWMMYRGEIPPSLHVLHTCDNSLCVNPDHLFLGTHAINMADAHKKGRLVGAPKIRGTHCPHDHEYTEANTRWRLCRGKPQAVCRQCERAREKLYKHTPAYWEKLARRKLRKTGASI